MVTIESYQPAHLPQLATLVNAHLEAVVPGWAVPEAFVADYLRRNPGEYVVDPWVVARATLCALERGRVVGVAHLLRYGSGPEVSLAHRGAGEIDWLLFWPEAEPAARQLLAAAHDQLGLWGTAGRSVTAAPPVGPIAGLPDVWPHVAAAVKAAGYTSHHEQAEAVYGGMLDGLPPPGAPPLPYLAVRRSVGRFGVTFAGEIDGEPVGHCECVSNLTSGGALPALGGWAELAELEVREPWRNRGVGGWLVRHAAAWLRLGGCDRIVLAVTQDDEARGAGRFYRRCGWDVLARMSQGWTLQGRCQDSGVPG
jgi:GNAT superfamily N-acetyltransferase